MKKLIGISLIALAITGCKSEIDNAETAIRNGLIYKYGETDPFTGLILNTPVGIPGISATCNSHVEKGRYDGKSECFYIDQKVYEVEFLMGNKDGIEQVFDAKTGEKISVKNWKSGRQDGLSEKYLNGNLVSRMEYKDGKLDGEQTLWSENGETILTELTWRTGVKYNGYETTTEGKANYLNGQLHGPQVKYGYHTYESLKQYISAEENYNNGKLDGIQKKYKNFLNTIIVKQESEVTYDNGVALSGWFKQFNDMDGSAIQEIKLIQSSKIKDENFSTEYPGDLVPDGVVRLYDRETDSPNGEEVWANGVKTKYTYISSVATTDGLIGFGDTVYNVLDVDASYEKYKHVTKSEYDTYGVLASDKTNALKAENLSTTTSDSCVDNWISAFRAEMGEDAMIVGEQLDEWKDWCSEGKQP